MIMMEECVGCEIQFNDKEDFKRSEFATDSYCKDCSYRAHEQGLRENGVDEKDITKEMKEW